jgi:hypothetical protein
MADLHRGEPVSSLAATRIKNLGAGYDACWSVVSGHGEVGMQQQDSSQEEEEQESYETNTNDHSRKTRSFSLWSCAENARSGIAWHRPYAP